MENVKKYSIRTKLYFLVFVFLIGLILCNISSYWLLQISRVNGPYYNQLEQSRELSIDIAPPDLFIIRPALLSFLIANETDPIQLKLLVDRFRDEKINYEDAIQKWERKLSKSSIQWGMLEKSDGLAKAFFELWNTQFYPEITSQNIQKARSVLLGPMMKLFEEHTRLLVELNEMEHQENTRIENQVEVIFRRALRLLVASWIIVLMLGVLIAYLISRSIKNQMEEVFSVLTSISSEINTKVDRQGQNVVQQSKSVNESTKTVDELNSSFKHTEALAHESSNRTKSALELSEKGNLLLQKMIDGLILHKNKVLEITRQINNLRDFVHQIHNITLVTSNLTSQTNILALNAAVQAAHAKDQSAGFSVIASEIRKLADESKKFLTNIDSLSESIKSATDMTISLSDEGNKNIQDTIQLAQNTLDAFKQLITINTSSFEGVEQVKLNVEHQSQAIQQISTSMGMLRVLSNHTVEDMEHVRSELVRLNKVSSSISEVV